MRDPGTTAYARSVVAGRIKAGKLVAQACQRHIDDMAGSKEYRFDKVLAARAIGFFESRLSLSAGVFEGEPFKLLGWQKFVVGSIFGWVRADGIRRFRTAYIETGKGSGKTPLAAGIAIYATFLDGEPSAETYILARTADQALVTFRPIARFAERFSTLEISGGTKSPYAVTQERTNSFIKRVSTETHGRGKSGPLPHCLICDEYHEHDTDAMLEFYKLGMKSRRQPLAVVITNAGAGLDTPCGHEHVFAERLMQGDAKDESYFAYVCSMDEGDKPMDNPRVWVKSNPSMPALPGADFIKQEVARARDMPSKRSLIERLIFCTWQDAESPWLDIDAWLRCETDELAPEAERQAAASWIAIDLSLKTDFTAAAHVWRLPAGEEGSGQWRYEAEVQLWTPADTLRQRAERDLTPYIQWRDGGFITAIPGKTIDYATVADWLIRRVAAHKGLQGVAYDPWKIDMLVAELERQGQPVDHEGTGAGLRVIPHKQGFASGANHAGKTKGNKKSLYMPRSIDAAEAMILSTELKVLKNPAVRSAAASTVAIMDASENRRLNKRKCTKRIDAMQALVMACGFATMEDPPDSSVFDNPDFDYGDYVDGFYAAV